jgi:hypothetical protein
LPLVICKRSEGESIRKPSAAARAWFLSASREESRARTGSGFFTLGKIRVFLKDSPELLRAFLQPVLEFWPNLLYFREVMRLNKNQVEHMAFIIVRNLTKEGKVILEDRGRIVESIGGLITEDFQKEDHLDQEVREILSKHMEKIRKENIEYQTMFRMIKTKLAKERNIVL